MVFPGFSYGIGTIVVPPGHSFSRFRPLSSGLSRAACCGAQAVSTPNSRSAACWRRQHSGCYGGWKKSCTTLDGRKPINNGMCTTYNVRPPSWFITPMSLWFMVLITIVTGAYKPTYNWGASHCINCCRISSIHSSKPFLLGSRNMRDLQARWMHKIGEACSEDPEISGLFLGFQKWGDLQ